MPALRLRLAACLIALPALLPAPAAAQQYSESYKFLNAVRDQDGNAVLEMVGRAGSSIVNTKDKSTGEGALHILVRKDKPQFLDYLLQQKADPDIRDRDNNTPLILAATLGKTDLVPLLLKYGANPNAANSLGETPLIIAVQHRDLDTVRQLVDKRANPDKTDNVGLSARAYAARDGRSPEIVKLLAGIARQPTRAVAGPKF